MKTYTIKRIGGYILPYKASLCAAILGALLSVPLMLLAPVLVGRAIDHILGPGRVEFEVIGPILLVMAGTVVAAGLLQWMGQVATRRLSAYAARDMRRQAFERLAEVPVKTLDNHPRGDLTSRLVNDADAVAEGMLQGIGQLFPGVVTILATVVIMLVLNPVIGVVVIVVTPLSILFARFLGRRSARMFRDMSAAQGAIGSYVAEMVRGQPMVRALGYEADSTEVFGVMNKTHADAYFKATFYSAVINPGTRLVNAIVFAAVGTLGGLYAIAGGITVGGLSAFLSYANQYTKPFNDVTAVLTQIQGAIASAERLFEVIDWAPEPGDDEVAGGRALIPAHGEGHVRAEGVSFSYRPDVPLIRDLHFNAEPGKRFALVGPTGCGKTTIINLLMRFYEIDEGTISVDGQDAKRIARGALRSLYGMVLQDTWLKNATVRENIAYAKPDATMEEVVAAAKEALAHGFIKRLPQGYDTVLKPGGEGLSAGQRQLLCIARIMLARPDILILDEATSSIDTRTEMLIQRALEKLMRGHTSFIVAHRLSTIQSADEILVMNKGRVIERGRHEELLDKGGFYAKLYNSQFGEQAPAV